MPDATTPVSPADMPEAPHMSNYVALSGERTATRRPLIIGGPQMGYYSPEIVMESVLRTPEFEARGISVPGLGPILIAGRTAEYAWTPTSGGTDATDVRAELLCEPDGSTPTRASRHYMYKGECRPMTRPPGAKANTAWRTVHGPVLSWGTVDGKPVGFAHQRYDRLSTPVSVIGFYRMQSGQTKTAEAFVDAARTVTLSLNLGYANANEVAYQHAGRYPVRAPGTRNDLPVWGTGEWEWRGRLDPRLQPFEIRPAKGYTMSWNNVPAPGWTSEGWWGGNAVHRADTLEDRFKHARGMTVDEVVKHHQDAATVDVEAFTLMPSIERILGNSAAPTPAAGQARAMLHAWADKGAHRRDANRDFLIDAAAATLIASLSDAMLDRTYRARLGEEAVRVIPVTDDRPGLDGSAYATSWASPLARELDRAAGVASSPAGVPAMCGGGDAEACRAVVWDALGAAYTKTRQSQLPWLRNTPTRWRSAASPILFLPVITLPKAMRWQNRPTFEQVSAFE
jgi:acyl-homoserine lactone acylase PvdQ